MTDEMPRGGTEPPGYLGPVEHGPHGPDGETLSRRTLLSAVWGGAPARVTTEHAMDVTEWNPSCSWYQYGKQLCLNGCQHPGMDIGIVRGTPLFAAEAAPSSLRDGQVSTGLILSRSTPTVAVCISMATCGSSTRPL